MSFAIDFSVTPVNLAGGATCVVGQLPGASVVPAFGAQALSTTGAATLGTLTTTGGIIRACTAIQTGASYQMLASDHCIPTDCTANNVTITLLANPETGREAIVDDSSVLGICGTPYRVIVSGGAKNIDGFGTSVTIASGRFSYTFRYNGTFWKIS